MWGKKKNKPSKVDSSINAVSSKSKPSKKSGLKRLIPSKRRAKSRSDIENHIGEIPKPIVSSTTPSKGTDDKGGFDTNITPVKNNKDSSFLQSILNDGDGNNINRFSLVPEKNVDTPKFSQSFSSGSSIDYFPDSPPGISILNDNPEFLSGWHSNDPPSEHINHDIILAQDFQEHLRKEQIKRPKFTSTEKDHVRKLKYLSQHHVEEKTSSDTDPNGKGLNNFRSVNKALGDDLTVSTVTTAFVSQFNVNGYAKGLTNHNKNEIALYPDMREEHESSFLSNSSIVPTTKDLLDDQRKKDKLIGLTRSALRRASNRFSLPAHLAKKWSVEISEPFKESKKSYYTFPILVRDRYGRSTSPNLKPLGPPTATTKRTLQDFCWLEHALRAEFHGALPVPLLAMSLGVNGWMPAVNIDKWHKMPNIDVLEKEIEKMEAVSAKEAQKNKGQKQKRDVNNSDVDHNRQTPIQKILCDWLSDILNGIRGHGELIMHPPDTDVFASEAMETFLFRNTSPLPSLSAELRQLQCNQEEYFLSDNMNVYHTSKTNNSYNANNHDAGFLKVMVHKSISCFTPIKEKGGSVANYERSGLNSSNQPRNNANDLKSPLVGMLDCTLLQSETNKNANDQNLPFSALSPISAQRKKLSIGKNFLDPSNTSVHSELITAQTELLFYYRKVALKCLTQIRSLLIEERQRNNSWKRLAIALTNLFAFEKDIEETALGENSPPRRNISSRNEVSKKMLESGLRKLSRQKKDRTIPSLKVLNCVLEAYVEDLSMAILSIIVHEDIKSKISNEFAIDNLNEQDGHDIEHQRWDLGLKQISEKIGLIKHQIIGSNELDKSPNKSGTAVSTEPTQGSIFHARLAYKRALEEKFSMNEEILKTSLAMLIKSFPIRFARMAWTFFKLESVQSSLLKGNAIKLRIDLSRENLMNRTEDELQKKEKDDDYEIELVQKILDLGNLQYLDGYDNISDSPAQRMRSIQREKVIRLARERLGRWNASLAMAVMETAGVEDAEVRVEEFTRDLRLVRKHAIGLREKVERCVEAIEALMVATTGDVEDLEENIEMMEKDKGDEGLKRTVSLSSSYEPSSKSPQTPLCQKSRNILLSNLAAVFSGALIDHNPEQSQNASLNLGILKKAGIDISDPRGWLVDSNSASKKRGNCGKGATAYFDVREANISDLLSRLSIMLREYFKRVEEIESFVYMHCVGIQLEKHFGKCRVKLVEAWEKKTDITTAINIATKKRLPQLVEELNAKLVAMSYVSHTAVKQAKDKHLSSKSLKIDLQNLSNRRFQRAKANASENVTAIIKLWLEHEENVALNEMKALGVSIREVERSVTEEDIKADGGAHLFAFVE